MPSLTRIVLDVLKPLSPNALEFASVIAGQHRKCRVKLTVTEMDEKTETTVITIEGKDIPYDAVVETITRLGGSVHSIDEVEVQGSGYAPADEA
jgi:hypothetical protein